MNSDFDLDEVVSSDTHCGFVAIVGRPNVGKSTLLNKILGQKVSITSRKPQTTRHRIVGIDTEGLYQTIYVDTPGLHKEEKRAINRLMNRAAESSIGDVELIFFVVDCARWNQDDEMVLEKIKQVNIPTVLVINKIDSVQNKKELLPVMENLSGRLNFKDVIPVSAKQGTNVETLKELAREYRKRNGKNAPAEIILIGGAAVIINYGFREMTYDADAIINASSYMKEAIHERSVV